MYELFASRRASSCLIAAVLHLALQSSVSQAQEGIQSQGSQAPAPSVAEDNGRERGSRVEPLIIAALPLAPVVTPPVQPATADVTGQLSIARVERPKIAGRRYVGSRGFTTGLRLVKMRQAIFSSDRGG